MFISAIGILLASIAVLVNAQNDPNASVPNSFPHFYPGIPNNNTNFKDSKAWQDYFLVKDQLPNATFSLERSFAGNLPVNRQGHPNDTLFFWAWETNNGSLTDDGNEEKPWMIWLNGGPGSSSMIGLLFENGPIHVANNLSLVKNEFGWNTLADTIWVDQPVGVGYATADSKGYVFDEDQMGLDFMRFLSNLVQVFPSLAKRPLYLTGESYAGTYIPYITKAYFGLSNPPVRLAKFVIGDGTIGSGPLFTSGVPTMQVIETYPQLIDYDPDVYNYFKEQTHLCGYDLNASYPMTSHFPSLRPAFDDSTASSSSFTSLSLKRKFKKSTFTSLLAFASKPKSSFSKRELQDREDRKAILKRDLSMRSNGTIDPLYECFLLGELSDYTVNFTKPWSHNDSDDAGFDVYSIPDALNPEAPQDGLLFMNDPKTRAALHAPTSKDWTSSLPYPFGNDPDGIDPSIEPLAFFDELAKNSSEKSVSWVIFSGNDDFLVAHWGSQLAIQNTSFGGTIGFTKPPSTPWFGDDNTFAGIVHQERNVTFVLFDKAGHLVSQWQPSRALTFVREFVLGSNPTGSLLPNGTLVASNSSSAAGFKSPLVGHILPAKNDPIFTGSGTTQGSTIWPSATIAAWDGFIATATATVTSPANGQGGNRNGAVRNGLGLCVVIGCALLGGLILL
ncbi:hypothetical protein M422DRAFT_233049 [Sphaerobolus stellatus SS14]|uniref:Carboxypeptidase n=1 Tax=Sphaerobolus stellatus (strain SS14) TaxID=990650 RepID=A0A0C9UJM6_SPHS4|nr:hypothetical protein M422DRAFT_233049 [Sphaerobolus stellatus SS14]